MAIGLQAKLKSRNMPACSPFTWLLTRVDELQPHGVMSKELLVLARIAQLA
jgi:hypothetical protein